MIKLTNEFFLKRPARYLYLKLVRTDDTPHSIALGMALGIFIAVFPTFGLGLILAVIFAQLIRANKAAALLGTAAFGAGFLSPFYWGASIYIGNLMLRMDLNITEIMKNVKAGDYAGIAKPVLIAYIAGNVLLSALCAIAGYYFFLVIINLHKARKAL